ncbi:MAG: RIP metalloprotease RseP [Candidatus Omnitrophota bacterium]|jgi:regulator of sigma E protease
MISLIVFLVIFGILIVVHEFGHFALAKLQGVRVERFSLGFGPALVKKKKNRTEYSINAIPLGGYVKLAGDNLEEYKGKPDEYFSKTPGQRAAIIFCGPLLNYILGFLCFWVIFFFGYPTLTTRIGGLLDGYGAKEAGLEVGDKIIAVDGKNVKSWDDLQMLVYNKQLPAQVEISFLRGDKETKVNVALKERQLDDQMGAQRRVGLLGITPSPAETVNVRYGPGKSFILSLKRTLDMTGLTAKAIWRMLTGKLSFSESVTGPLGIYYITSHAARLGMIAVLHLMAILSISLGIFNLLPLPVLDGGHIVLLAIEKVRGRALSIKAERIITQIGVTLIVSLAVFVTYNDILRFFGDKLPQWIK